MRAESDSEADALSIGIVENADWDDTVDVEPDFCHVALTNGRVANIELLAPRKRLDLLTNAAGKFALDAEALVTAAKSALEAPDRVVIIDVREREMQS